MAHAHISFSSHRSNYGQSPLRFERREWDPEEGGRFRHAAGITAAVVSHVMPELVDRNHMAIFEPRRTPAAPLSGYERYRAEEFVQLLFEEEGSRCERFADRLLDTIGDPQTVAAVVFEPAARELGLAWCDDSRDFLKVTVAVARMQRIFRQMVADCPPPPQADAGKWALIGPTPGEQHTFGLCIVEDALRRAGWLVDCCAGGEEAEIIRLAASNSYAIIGLSLSCEEFLPRLGPTIRKLRAKSMNRSVTIVVGGSLVADRPGLALEAGADLVGGDSVSIVRLSESSIVSFEKKYHISVAAE